MGRFLGVVIPFIPPAGRKAGSFVLWPTGAPRGRRGRLLCILGFAFDPQALGVTADFAATDGSFDVAAERSLGRVPVLLVRMNSDLVMGEELKKTGAGNLFTVFGEPDIDVTATSDGHLVVEVKGVDVYDPTTGEVRSSGTDQVALWMIDTDMTKSRSSSATATSRAARIPTNDSSKP
jgi:hypothetical protein